MAFPVERPRRLRATAAIRNLVRETELNPGDCILPLFICPGEDVKREACRPEGFGHGKVLRGLRLGSNGERQSGSMGRREILRNFLHSEERDLRESLSQGGEVSRLP